MGKLKALTLVRYMDVLVRKPVPGPSPEDRARLEAGDAALRQLEAQERAEEEQLRRELDAARRALAETQAAIDRAGDAAPDEEEPSPLSLDKDEASSPPPEREPPPIAIWPTATAAAKSGDH